MRFRCLALLFLSSQAYGLSLDDVRAIVKDAPKNSYSAANHGFLCERIAIRSVLEQKPGAEVLNGVEYRFRGRVIGELDLVVIEEGEVSEVIEVKCMKSFSSAAEMADEQLARVDPYLGRCDVDFSLDGDDLPCEIFSAGEKPALRKMSYSDARAVGFDYDIGVSRRELLRLIEGY